MTKKISVFLSILFVIFTVSCASTTETPNSAISPEIEESIESDTKNLPSSVEIIISNDTDEPDDIDGKIIESNNSDINEKINKESDFEIPQDFEEPLVRDLPAIEEQPLEDIEISTEVFEQITEIEDLEPISENDITSSDKEQTDATEQNPNETTDELQNNDEINEDSEYTETEDSFESELNNDSEYTENEDETSDENTNDNEEIIEEVVEEIIEEVIIPSRSVTLKKGENLIVIYPGSGWIYMGSLSEYNNLASKGRKLGSENTKYTLLAKEAGTQIHHFYKVDNLTGDYIDDYLEVTVLDKKGSSKTSVTAPDYATIVPNPPVKPAKATIQEEIIIPATEEITNQPNIENNSPVGKTSENTNTIDKTDDELLVTKDADDKNQNDLQIVSEDNIEKITKTTNNENNAISLNEKQSFEYIPEDVNSENDDVISIDESAGVFDVEDIDISIDEDFNKNDALQINTDELLDNAIKLYQEGLYSEANDLLTEFFEYAINRQDEALFLQGQLLETDSPLKDIKSAIQTYELLIKNYPASIYWNDANKRIKYLRKFYYLSN